MHIGLWILLFNGRKWGEVLSQHISATMKFVMPLHQKQSI